MELSFNIDGIPLFKSSNIQLWPILGMVHNFKIKSPFAIAIFCGTTKPKPLSKFLHDFIQELALLQQNGFLYNGIDYQVKTRCFICDAPARAFLKCIKSHGGYSSCEKCTDPGKYLGPGRVILENVNAELRTDESFRLQKDSDHHKEEITPLLQLNIGLVTSFPIDYMHNVCLGVTRKIINCWISGKYKTRLSFRQIANLSERMLKTKHCIPIEINRKPRSLNELARFKATEFLGARAGYHLFK
ncbi:hypothetical protein PPYR_02310 [Photinus pyralis]|uniref:Uncharacterized protein n=1 Tax=Photinus pyralis TaxID=7054 RepID=A0A5N4B7L0_PHOPY|nr:hypothetical protein PPYR_02310 [Photinus pyralis]